MTLFHANLAMSLDGRIARADGGVDWLEPWPPEPAEWAAFLGAVDAILMGRATYEAVRGFGDWPYPGKPTVVVTSRPLVDPPAGVTAEGGGPAAAVAGFEAAGAGRVWAAGGARVLTALLALGRLDVLELTVVPVLLGDGIGLLAPGAPQTRLALAQAAPWRDGAARLVYRRT